MNENTSNHGSVENSANDELLARITVADPAASFDLNTLSATLVDDAIARAASSAAPARRGAAGRLAAGLARRFALAYQTRLRFVLGSSLGALGAVAAVAAIAVFGSSAFGGGPAHTIQLSLHGEVPTFSYEAPAAKKATTGAQFGSVAFHTNQTAEPGFVYDFEADPGLSNQTGSSRIYQIVAPTDKKTYLQKIAAAFGVQGEIIKGKYNEATNNPFEGQVYQVLKDHGIKSTISLSGWEWWFNNLEARPIIDFCNMDLPKTDTESCFWAPSESVALPNREEVVNQVVEKMAALGEQVSPSDVSVERNRSTTVATVQIATIASYWNRTFTFTWNKYGELSSVNGDATNVIDMGVHDTLSPTQAVARANDKTYNYMTNPVPMRPAIFSVGTALITPSPQVIHKTVHVDGFKGTFTTVVDTAGITWIVPAYELHDGKDKFGYVPAMPENLIDVKTF